MIERRRRLIFQGYAFDLSVAFLSVLFHQGVIQRLMISLLILLIIPPIAIYTSSGLYKVDPWIQADVVSNERFTLS